MKRSPQVSLSSAMKRSFVSFAALFLVLSVFGANVLAVPIAVDMYQDMESGNAGDVLTASIMNASSHPSSGWGTTMGSLLWVSTTYHRDLPSPILVGGVTYNGTGGTRTWTFKNDNQLNFVQWTTGGHANVTMASYYTTLTTVTQRNGYDTLIMWGSSFAVMQTLPVGPRLRPHSSVGHSTTGAATPGGPDEYDTITTGKTYWVNLKYDGSVAEVMFAAFDPDNNYAQVGTTLIAQSKYNDTSMGWKNYFGRGDQHGSVSNDLTYSYFDHIMFDWTNGAFPLLPSGANDATAPGTPPVVRDGTGADQSIALSTTQLSANWDMAWDAQSGIKAYQYAIGTTQGGTNVTNWTSLPNQLGVTKTGLTLTTGQTYYFSVKAINGVGITGSATNSNGQTVGTDATAPGAPVAVRDAAWAYNYLPDIDETTSASSLWGNFDPAIDNESGISFYQFAVGTTPGATDFLGWTTLSANSVNAWASPVTATPGQRYYFTVKAINNAGITGPVANSNGQTVVNQSDTTPPSAPPAVRDGTGTDISTTSSTTQLSANWDNSTDNESGISGYYYAIGTTLGGTNIVNDTRVTYNSPISSITSTGLSLTVGQTYYFRIKAINGKTNGLVGAATNSNGVTVVSGGNQPPSAPANVRDGTGTDVAYTTSTTQLSANWDASTDPDGSVTAYQYAIGTSAGGTQTVNWTTLGNVTTVTKTGLALTSGQTYYFSVKAVDNQGLAGNATNSNGQTVDTTAPGAPATVRDGTSTDIVYTGSTTQLSANWDAAADAESGISGYQYAIGTSAGGTQTVNFTSLGNVTTVTKTGLALTNGQTYYFSVKAVNGAGLTGNATNSNGQTVDSSAPSAPAAIRDGTGADISTTSSTTQLSANWDASTDSGSGISGYQYAIGTSAGGTQTVNFTSLGNVTTVTKTGLTLSVGQTYYFSVKAVNGAGLTGSATNSNGQTVVSGGGAVTYFQDNFEGWAVHGGAWSSVSGESSTHTLDTSTDYAKAGAKSLKLTDTDTSGLVGALLQKNFSPAISGDVYTRFYLFLPTGYGSTNVGCLRKLYRIYCGAYRVSFTINGETSLIDDSIDWLTVSGPALSENAWHCVEVHVTAPTASTTLEIWIDGTYVGSRTANFSSAGTTWDYIQLGDTPFGGGSTNGNGTYYEDELVVSNSYIGTGITAPVTYFSDTFDSWAVHGGAWSSVLGENSNHTLNTSTDHARGGTKSLKLTDTDSTGTTGASLTKNFSPVISGDIYVRFYVFLPTGYESANTGCVRRLLRVYCQSNRGQMSLNNGIPKLEEVGSWGYVSSSSLSENAWHCIETHITTPAATTALEFWVDGVWNNPGLTANFSTSTTWDHIDFGDVVLATGCTNGDGTFYLDELVVSNSYIGPLP